MKTALELITDERHRQIRDRCYTEEHDDKEHSDGSLGLAAACYASPDQLYTMRRNFGNMEVKGTIVFEDPYPFLDRWTQRGEPRSAAVTTLMKKQNKTRIEQLTIAGALILADLERELRAEQNKTASNE